MSRVRLRFHVAAVFAALALFATSAERLGETLEGDAAANSPTVVAEQPAAPIVLGR